MNHVSKQLNEILQKRKRKEKVVLLFGASKLTGILGHIEALKIVQQLDISFDAVYGSQIGSIFASMYSYDISYKVILDYVLNSLSAKNIFDYRIKEMVKKSIKLNAFDLNGICYGYKFASAISTLLQFRKKAHVDDLYIFAEYYSRNKLKIFHAEKEIDTLDAIRASNAFAALYPPVKFEGESYIESGVFGGLPLYEIYKHQKKLRGLQESSSRKNPVTILAFQEGFAGDYPHLTITERLMHSFHEKIRYHSVNIALETISDLPVRLILISFDSRSVKEKSVLKLNKNERLKLAGSFEHDIASQVKYYYEKMHLKTDEPHSIIR